VALFAGGGESRRHVVRPGGSLVILGVTGVALRRQALELPDRRPLVTGIAIQSGVRAQQREAVLVLLNLLHRDLPSLDGVALFAVRAELPLVNISMAIGALVAHVGEHRFGVALGAGHALVHAAQGKARLVVIEFGCAPDRLPPALRVTVLAGNVQRPMGAAAHTAGPSLAAAHRHGQREPHDCLQQECRKQVPHPHKIRLLHNATDKTSVGLHKSNQTAIEDGKCTSGENKVTEVADAVRGWTTASPRYRLNAFLDRTTGSNGHSLGPNAPQLSRFLFAGRGIRPMASGAILRRRFVKKNCFGIYYAGQFVAGATGNIAVSPRQWKCRPFVVIEQRGLPASAIVALCARSHAVGLGELSAVDVLMTFCAILRGCPEIHMEKLGLKVRRLVTTHAGHSSVLAKQGKRRLAVVKA
jgi:hypothetical protein